MTELTKMASSSDCGCGGGGCGGSGGSCSQCGQECAGGPLQRPLFFSGQLLTEEDLQLLSDYAATKMRLHNRYLHGAGVVCGLQVVCHPCGGGQVIVQPGAALDCCGNDIYVPCAVELDVNDMVNALRLEKRGGYDCGDPCEKPCDDSPDDVRCIERAGRRYCLYVRYCEELEEPVTPYLTGGDCALQVCKPTRIREGYRFELRCPEEEEAPDDLFRRLLCCIGDLDRAEKAADDTLAVNRYGERYMAAREQIAKGQVGAFGVADHEEVKSAGALESIASASFANAEGQAAPKVSLTEAQVRSLIDRYQIVASAVIRYDMQPDQVRAELAKSMSGLTADVEKARGLVQDAREPLKSEAAAKLVSAQARVVAETWIDQGAQYSSANLDPAQRSSPERLRYALGVPSSPAMRQAFGRDVVQLREWLLERIENKVLASDCRLRRDLLAVEIPPPGSNREEDLYEAERRLTEIMFRYLIDCICAALNPPCQPCLDPAVKLACLTVDDCEVVKICNLERTFVLSGPAIRYWVPFLHMIGELLEKACCELEIRVGRRQPSRAEPVPGRDPATGVPRSMVRSKGYMESTAPLVASADVPPQVRALLRLANIDEREATARINTVASFGRLAGEAVTLDHSFDSTALAARMKSAAVSVGPDTKEAARSVIAPLESKVAELNARVEAVQGETSEKLIAPVANEVSALSARVEAVQKEAADKVAPMAGDLAELRDRVVAEEATRAATERQVTKSLDAMRKEVAGIDKRLAGDSTLVKELRKALDEQRKRSDALEARLGKLEPKKG